MLEFERAVWISRRPRRINSTIFELSCNFRRKHTSFVELVKLCSYKNKSLLRGKPPQLEPLKLNRRPGRLLGHLR